ncbi:tetratricopeptide repeat protein [Cytobacillus massiliigabonensis]|uniref:tetratricopeptide repeat protein n=1 Tax=Cytobacillus massiliigabonensis TaxID=1871011 RepID=UPI000C8673E5|nr:CFI-box-CTERM domain-containing protein [Cytobacillus massiliigabonensis]
MNDYDQTEQQIELLARILSQESPQSSIQMQWKDMKEIVGEIEGMLDEEAPFGKLDIMNRLIDKVELIEEFLKHPGSIGKSRIGLLYDSSRARTQLYSEIFKTSKFQPILLKNNDIPLIHQFNKEDQYTIVNRHQHEEKIDGKALYTIIREFVHTRQMDLKEMIQHVLIESALPYEHLTFTDLNLTGNVKKHRMLIKNTDIIILNLTFTKNWQSILGFLHEIKYEGRVVILVKDKKDELHQLIKGVNLEIFVLKDSRFDKVKKLLDTWNKPINNLFMSETIEESILELLADLQNQLQQSYQIMETINKTLLFVGQGENSPFYELRDAYQEKINKQDQLIQVLTKRKVSLQEIITELEKSLKHEFIDHQGITIDLLAPVHKHQKEVTYRLTELLIQTGEYERAKQFIHKLLSHNYNKAHILLIYLQKKKGLAPIKYSIDKILSLPNNDDKIIEAKIWLKEALALNQSQVAGLSRKLKETRYPKALYYKGVSFETADLEQAVSYYKKAFQLGCKEAGDRLFKVWNKKGQLSIENLTFLGDLLHPEANYLLAQGLKSMKPVQAALVIGFLAPLFSNWNVSNLILYRLSLASAAGYSKAASDLSDVYMADKKYEQAIQVCLFAIDKFDTDLNFQEKLGVAYFKSNQFAKSAEILQKINTGESCFLIGLMFEKGYGKVVNLPKALDYYRRGKELGSSEAHTHYIKLSTRLEEEKKAKEQNKTKSYNSSQNYTSSSSSYSSSSSSSSCFLTTATCKAMGKEDDCEEILSFKAFRDSWLINEGDGVSLIKEYYKIAPLIVDQIENSSAPLDVYTSIWNTYIQKGYDYLLQQEFEKAKDLYIAMVLELKRRYLSY